MNPARKNHQVYTRLTGLEKLVRINNCIEFLFKLQVAQLRASGVKRGKKNYLSHAQQAMDSNCSTVAAQAPAGYQGD